MTLATWLLCKASINFVLHNVMRPLAIVQRGLVADQVITTKQLHDFLATHDVSVQQANAAFGIPKGTRFEKHKGRTIFNNGHSYHVDGRHVRKRVVDRILQSSGGYKRQNIRTPASVSLKVNGSTGRVVKTTRAAKKADRRLAKFHKKADKRLVDTTMSVWEFLKPDHGGATTYLPWIEKDGATYKKVALRGDVYLTLPKYLYDRSPITVLMEGWFDSLVDFISEASRQNDKYGTILKHFAKHRESYLAGVTFGESHPHDPSEPYDYHTRNFHLRVGATAICSKYLNIHLNWKSTSWKDVFHDELDPDIGRPFREMRTLIDWSQLADYSCVRNAIMYAHFGKFPTINNQYARKTSRPCPSSLPDGGLTMEDVKAYAVAVRCKFIAVDIYGQVIASYHPKEDDVGYSEDRNKVPPLYLVLHNGHAGLVTRTMSFGEIFWKDDRAVSDTRVARVMGLRKYPLPSRPKGFADPNANEDNKMMQYVPRGTVDEQLDAIGRCMREICFTEEGVLRAKLPVFSRIAVDASNLKEHIYRLMRDNKSGLEGDVHLKKVSLRVGPKRGVKFILSTAFHMPEEGDFVHGSREVYEGHQAERDRLFRSVISRRNMTRWHRETQRKLRMHAPRVVVSRCYERPDRLLPGGFEDVKVEIDQGKAYFNALRKVGAIARCDRFSRWRKRDNDWSREVPLKDYVERLPLQDFTEYLVEVDPAHNPDPVYFNKDVGAHLGKILKGRPRGGWRVLEELVPSDVEPLGHIEHLGEHLYDKSTLPKDIRHNLLRHLTGWLRMTTRESSSVQYFSNHSAAWSARNRLGTGDVQTYFAEDGGKFYGVEECVVADLEESFEMLGNHIVDYVNALNSDMVKHVRSYCAGIPHSLAIHTDAVKIGVAEVRYQQLTMGVEQLARWNTGLFQSPDATTFQNAGKWTLQFNPTTAKEPGVAKPMTGKWLCTEHVRHEPAPAWAAFSDIMLLGEDEFEKDDAASVARYETNARHVKEGTLDKHGSLLIEGSAGDGKSVLCRQFTEGKEVLYVTAHHVIRERLQQAGFRALTAKSLNDKRLEENFGEWRPDVLLVEEARLLTMEDTDSLLDYIEAHPSIKLLGNSDVSQHKPIETRLNYIDKEVHQDHRLALLFGSRLLLRKDKRIDRESRVLKDSLMAALSYTGFALDTTAIWCNVPRLTAPSQWLPGATHLTYRNTTAVWASSVIEGRFEFRVGDELVYRGGTVDNIKTQSSRWRLEAMDEEGYHLSKGSATIVEESEAAMRQYRFTHAATGYALQGMSCDLLIVHDTKFHYAREDMRSYLNNALGRMTTLRQSPTTGFYIYEDNDVYSGPGREAAANWLNLPDLSWFTDKCRNYRTQDRQNKFNLELFPTHQSLDGQYLKDRWKRARGCCYNCQAELTKHTAVLHRPNVHLPHLKQNGVWCCATCNSSFAPAEQKE